MNEKFRVGYFAGPGNVCDTYRRWLLDRDFTSQSTYSGQFYELVSSFDRSIVISSHPIVDEIRDDPVYIYHLPNINKSRGALFF